MPMIARQFVEKLNNLGSKKNEYDDVGMGQVFALAHEFMEMSPGAAPLPPRTILFAKAMSMTVQDRGTAIS